MTVPTTLYPVLANVINRVREGETTTKACREYGTTVATFLKAVKSDQELSLEYDDALQQSYDRLAEKLINIDEDYPDAKMAKVVSGNIQWLIERRKPEGYGKRLTIENHSSADTRIIHALQAAIERIPLPAQDFAPEMKTIVDREGATIVIEASVTDQDIEDLKELGIL